MFRFGDPGGRGYNALGASQVNLLAWWNGSNGNTSSFTITASGGRSGGNSLHRLGGQGWVSKTFDNQVIWGVAFALKVSSISNNGCGLFEFRDAGNPQCSLLINLDGSLIVNRGGTGIASSSSPIPLNTWVHVEWKTKIDPSVGTHDVRINGISVLTYSGNTRSTANSSANQAILSNTSSNTYTCDFDDIIIWDGQANDPQGHPDIHDFIGDCTLTWLLPNGDGTTTQFTKDSGTNNYLRVADATPDGDASYVQDTNAGDIDTYAMANLPGNIVTVKSLAVMTYAEKTDAGTKTFCAELRTNSANFDGSVSQSLGNSYTYYFNSWGQNPSGTPANWTVTDVNALEVGQKVLS